MCCQRVVNWVPAGHTDAGSRLHTRCLAINCEKNRELKKTARHRRRIAPHIVPHPTRAGARRPLPIKGEAIQEKRSGILPLRSRMTQKCRRPPCHSEPLRRRISTGAPASGAPQKRADARDPSLRSVTQGKFYRTALPARAPPCACLAHLPKPLYASGGASFQGVAIRFDS